ncbi:MAG: hypothetical protein ABI383_03185 [Acidobacteriaceae bacterium]
MSSQNLSHGNLLLPEDLVQAVDSLVGVEHRNQFLVDAVREKVRLVGLLEFLDSDQPFIRDEDHPEWAKDAAEWVHSLRREGKIPSVDDLGR